MEAGAGDEAEKVENGLVELGAFSLTAAIQSDRAEPASGISIVERMAHYGVPGVGVAVVDNYEVAWANGYGVLEAGGAEAVDRNSVFEAASTTKLLVSVIVMQQVERGALDLDENVNARLQSWKVPNGELTESEGVTLRRLLTHQSGLNRPDGGFDSEDGSVPSLVQVLEGAQPALNAPARVEFVPGSQWQYSNFAYLVVQMLLEDAMGTPFSEIAAQSLFDPIAMDHSTLKHPLSSDFDRRLAPPHDQEGTPHRRAQHPTALAQGGLVTTPGDLALFMIEMMSAWAGRSERVVSQQTVRTMCSVERDLDPSSLGGISGQGLGVFLVGEGENQYFLYAGDNAPGATSLLVASPHTGKGVVIMANGAAGLPLSLEILTAVARVYDWPGDL